MSGLNEQTAFHQLIEETHNYQQWLKPLTKSARLKFWQQESTQSKLITRLNEVCDLIEIVLETTYYRVFTKSHVLRFLRSHFKKKRSGAYVIGFKIAAPMLDAKITDFVMLITFVMVPACSLHKLSD